MRHLSRPLALLLVAATACGEGGSADDAGPTTSDATAGHPDATATAPDAGSDDAAVAPDSGPACDLGDALRPVTASEGGRVRIPSTIDGDALELSLPPGWYAAQTGTVTHVRVPYGVQGPHAVDVTRRCASGGTARGALSVDVQRLDWVALPAWRDGVDGPSSREHPIVFIDPADPDHLFLYGGYAFRPRQFTIVHDLWSYDLVADRWTARTSSRAPHRGGGRAVLLPGATRLALMGGSDDSFTTQLALDQLELSRDEAIWTRQPLLRGVGAHASELGGLVYDAPRDRIVSACGYNNGDVHCQVAAYDRTQQTYDVLEPAAGDRPTPRYGFFAAHDVENQRLVMFGGAQDSIPGNLVNPAGDTWALELDEDPVRWVRLVDTSSAVPGRRNGCSAFDPVGQRFFFWGGTPDAMNTEQGLYALDLIAGHEQITRVEITPPKAARSSCAAVYDGARRRILFGFGNNSTAIFADWVALEL